MMSQFKLHFIRCGRVPLIWLILILCSISLALEEANSKDDRDKGKEANPRTERVSVEIDYGDGFKRIYTQIEWRKELTVLSALHQVSAHPRGVKFEFKGSGGTAFLTSIDDVKNEGGAGRNWMFGVNGKKGNRSFAISELSSGDAVLWKFELAR